MDFSEISTADSILIDSNLATYHRDIHDTTKYKAIELIVEESYDFYVWTSYNYWLYNKLSGTDFKNLNEIENRKMQNLLSSTIANIGFQYDWISEYETAILYYQKSLSRDIKLNDLIGITKTYNNIGMSYESLGEIDSALHYVKLSLKLAEETNNEENISIACNNLGNIYSSKGNLAEALNYYEKSFEINKKSNNLEGLSTDYNNIALVYDELGMYEKAIEYLKKAIDIKIELGDNLGPGAMYANLSSIFRERKKYALAKEFIFKAIELDSLNQDDESLSSSLNSLGHICVLTNENKTAIKVFQKSLKISRSIDYLEGVGKSNFYLAEVYFDLNDIKKAKRYALRAEEISNQLGFPEFELGVSKLLHKIYKEEGNIELAYANYYTYTTLKDSLNNDELAKKTLKKDFDNAIEKTKLLEKANNAEIQRQRAQIESDRAQQYGLYGGIVLLLVFGGFMFNRFRVTQKQKEIISAQKNRVEVAHKQLEVKTEEIEDSIKYAKRLQNAILPPLDTIKEYLTDSFIYFNPKDVVSGDFYWFEKKGERLFMAVADCTGHGVPGAMVSVVCCNALNRVVNEFKLIEPAPILDKTRELVIETFAKSGEDVKDGMDIALCAIETNKVIFAGANNPLWIVRREEHLSDEQKGQRSTVIEGNNALIEFKGDKQPIGLYDNMAPFNQIEVDLLEGDSLYFFTDGFADQFGGVKGKKLMYKPFKRLLLEINSSNIEKQKNTISAKFDTWKSDYEQVDDVCVVGIKI